MGTHWTPYRKMFMGLIFNVMFAVCLQLLAPLVDLRNIHLFQNVIDE